MPALWAARCLAASWPAATAAAARSSTSASPSASGGLMCGIRQARYSAAATGCAAAPGAGCCPYGTSQYSESEQAPTLKPNSHTTSQEPGTPPIIPDQEDTSISTGWSQVVSVRAADPKLKELVHKVFSIYEARTPEKQASLVAAHYHPGAIYEDNMATLQGTDALLKRFALLPATCSRVVVEYAPPVTLGATTSAPGTLEHLGDKGELQVEVENTQRYTFAAGGANPLRWLVLPTGDVQFEVLTRLTVDRSTLKVLYHKDLWRHKAEMWEPLRKVWGALDTGAAAVTGATGGGKKEPAAGNNTPMGLA